MSLFGIIPAGRAEEKYRVSVEPYSRPEHQVADLVPYMDQAIDRLIELLDTKRAEIAALAMHRASTLGVREYGTAAFEKDNHTDTMEELADGVFYVSCDIYQDEAHTL